MFILGVSAVSTLNSVFLKKFKATIDCKNSFSFYNEFLYKFFLWETLKNSSFHYISLLILRL